MKFPPIIRLNYPALANLCQIYRVEKLYVFGSIVNGNFDVQTSDIDLVVELEPMPPLEKGRILMDFWADLEKLFGRKVDLLTDQPIKNPFLKRSIEQTKQLVYERESQKISV